MNQGASEELVKRVLKCFGEKLPAPDPASLELPKPETFLKPAKEEAHGILSIMKTKEILMEAPYVFMRRTNST